MYRETWRGLYIIFRNLALDTVGAEFIRDVEPGEMVVIIDGK